MIRRPPRSTLDRSSAASDVYKRQDLFRDRNFHIRVLGRTLEHLGVQMYKRRDIALAELVANSWDAGAKEVRTVSYTHLRAHETVLDLVCRLLLEKKTKDKK